MNILFFHNNGIDPIRGGISRITYSLCQRFREEGHKVYILSVLPPRANGKYDSEQYFLPSSNLKSKESLDYIVNFCSENNINFILNQAGLSLKNSIFLKDLTKHIDVKVINCFHNSILAPIYNYPYQKEFIWRRFPLNILLGVLKQNFIRKLLVQLYILRKRTYFKDIVKNSDAVVVLCDGLKTEVEELIGNESNKIVVIPNFSTLTCSNVDKKDIVVWAGTIDFSIKRLDKMLKIWHYVEDSNSNVQLKILGDGPNYNDARTLASKLKLKNVTFEGRCNPLEYYKSAKMIAVTSSHESFSLVLLEGMQCGCVPIAFNSFPAASMLINNEINGYLILNFSECEYAKKIIDFFEDSNIYKQMELSARNKSLYFSSIKIYNKWSHLFKDLENGKR